METPIRSAALAIAAALAVAASARTTSPVPPDTSPDALAVAAQFAIRGYDDCFAIIDRFTDSGSARVKSLIAGMGAALTGINPFDLVDTAYPATARAILYLAPGRTEPGAVFDFPAAAGDPVAALDKLAAAPEPFALVPVELSERAASRLPDGARIFRPHSPAKDGKDPRILFFPHDKNVAMVFMSSRGGANPGQIARCLAHTPAPSVPGAVKFEIRLDPFLATFRDNETPSAAAWKALVRDFPFNLVACGLGLDGSDNLRIDCAVHARPGHPFAEAFAAASAPSSPLANAILFPDALAAGSGRFSDASQMEAAMDWTLRFQEYLFARLAEADAEVPFPFTYSPDAARAQYLAGTALVRLLGPECNWAVLPAADGVAAPWAVLAFPDDPAAALDALPAHLGDCLDTLLAATLDATQGMMPEEDAEETRGTAARLAPRIELDAERTVRDIPLRTFALRITDTDAGRTIDLATFDAAAAGPALYLGRLPDSTLSGVLDDLTAGATARGPVPVMPAVAALDTILASPNAAAGYARLVPLARTLLAALRGRLETIAGTCGGEDAAPDAIFPVDSDALDGALADAEALFDGTVAWTQEWIPAIGRLSASFAIPAADVRAAVMLLRGHSLSTIAATAPDDEALFSDDDFPEAW